MEHEEPKHGTVIVCPDSTAGYRALHEYIQQGWEPIYQWTEVRQTNHVMLRRKSECESPNLEKLRKLAYDLLSPEMYGHAVNPEIRDRARRCLGMEPVETVRRKR